MESRLLCTHFIMFFILFPPNNVRIEKQIKPANRDYWPFSGWETSSIEEQELNAHKFSEMETYIKFNNLLNGIDSILVIRNGYLVYESYPSNKYDESDRHHLYSCTKAFTSALIGIAIEEGLIGSVEDRVLDYFSDKTFEHMDSRKQSITIKHLLSMTSGLVWTDQVNFYEMQRADDWVQYILEQPMEHQPGSVWNYNTGCSQLLAEILDRETETGTYDYAKEKFLPH